MFPILVKVIVLFGSMPHVCQMDEYNKTKNAGRTRILLGKLLSDARKSKNLSRAKLAELADVGANSIVRYEQAGVDEIDGQYPPVDKLARLCYHLDISPKSAIWASLPDKEFREVEGRNFEEVMNDPSYGFMMRQYDTLLRRNHFLGEALSIILEIDDRRSDHEFPNDDEDDLWLRDEIKKVVGNQKAFEHRMLMLGIATPLSHGQASVPNDREEAWYSEVSDPRPLPMRESQRAGWIIENTYERLKDAVAEMEQRYPKILENKKSSEDDLPSPPSPDPKPTKPNLENDDGYASE